MIIDSLKGLERYTSFHPHFQKAFDFIRKEKLEQLPVGLHPIEGDELLCQIWEGDATTRENATLMAHDSYIMIHLLLEGSEIIAHKDRSNCDAEQALYKESEDLLLFKEQGENLVSLSPGNLAILFPHDAYTAAIGNGPIKKAIIRVRY